MDPNLDVGGIVRHGGVCPTPDVQGCSGISLGGLLGKCSRSSDCLAAASLIVRLLRLSYDVRLSYDEGCCHSQRSTLPCLTLRFYTQFLQDTHTSA